MIFVRNDFCLDYIETPETNKENIDDTITTTKEQKICTGPESVWKNGQPDDPTEKCRLKAQ